ncbi:MAG: AMP-binding protein, partial [bacterium]|nr:AMP-binding protein [bacterium]
NMLPLKNNQSGEPAFREYLKAVHKKNTGALENQDYPFEELVEKVMPHRDTRRNPLFDTVFALIEMDRFTTAAGPLTMTPYEMRTGTAKFELTLQALETGDRVALTFEYAAALYKENRIRRYAGYIKQILREVTAEPGKKISEIELLSLQEKRQLLLEFNATGAEYPAHKTVHRIIEEQLDRNAHHIAVAATSQTCPHVPTEYLTYGVLDKEARQLAGRLQNMGVNEGTVTAVMAAPTLEMIIAVLGVLKAGGVYLPIDPAYPGERVDSTCQYRRPDPTFSRHYRVIWNDAGGCASKEAVGFDVGL